MKMPNGYGSVSRLSGNRRKPFVVRVPKGKSITGSIKHTIIGYYATREEALDALATYRQHPAEKITITLSQLYAEWSERKYRKISHCTVQNYEASWIRFLPLYAMKVKDIRTYQLQKIIDTGAEKGLSHSSLSKDKALATMLFKYAMENDIVSKNYAEFMELPKNDEISSRDSFTMMELTKIEKAAADGIPWADTILILCYTGFRINEFLSLTPFSYKDGNLIGGSKTDAGKNRIIPVHSKIKTYVDKWATKKGTALICNQDGKNFRADFYRDNCFYPALEKIGIRKLTPHCCRHTFATILANAKADPLEIQRLMGHSKYSMTADVYTHVNVEKLRSAIDKLG